MESRSVTVLLILVLGLMASLAWANGPGSDAEEPTGPVGPPAADTTSPPPTEFEKKELDLILAIVELQIDKKWDDAHPLAEQLLKLEEDEKGPDHPDILLALDILARGHRRRGEVDRSEALYLRAIAVAEKNFGPDDPRVAEILAPLAKLYSETTDFRRAMPLMERALAIEEKGLGPEHPNVARDLNWIGDLFNREGRYREAEPWLTRALALREKVLDPNHPDIALSLNSLWWVYYMLGDYDRAAPLIHKSLEILVKNYGDEQADTAAVLNNMAEFNQTLGAYDQAEIYFNRSLAAREKLFPPDHPEIANSLNNLAAFYFELGSYARAEPLYRRALEISEHRRGPNHPDVAVNLSNLAMLYKNMDRLDEAEAMFRRALDIFISTLGPGHGHVAVLKTQFAALAKRRGNYDDAERLYLEALEIDRNAFGDRHPDVAADRVVLGGLYLDWGRYDQAEDQYRKALAINEGVFGPDHHSVADDLSGLAQALAGQEQDSEALDVYRRAQAIDDRMIDQIIGFASQERQMEYLATTRDNLFRFLSLAAWRLPADEEARRTAFDVWLRRKGVLLEAQRRYQEALVYADDPEALATFQELARVRAELSQKTFAGPAPGEEPEAYRKRIEDLGRERDRLDARLSQLSRPYDQRKKLGRTDTRKLAAALPKGSRLVEFVYLDRFDFRPAEGQPFWKPAHYLAFVLAPGEPAGLDLVDLGEADSIDQAVQAYRRAVEDSRDMKGAKAFAAGRRLYDQVALPLLARLGDSRDIFISPDGLLNLIPFEVLPDPNGRYLIEDYTFNYLTSGRDAAGFGQEPSAQGPALLIGDPAFDLTAEEKDGVRRRLQLAESVPEETRRRSADMGRMRFGPLPGAREELAAVRNLLGVERTELHTGVEAIEEVLHRSVPPKMLHLATHGFFLTDEAMDALDRSRSQSRSGEDSAGPGVGLENPLLRSGLALAGANNALAGEAPEASDGLLTAEKVLGLRLRGTELVVLSACDTGVGTVKNGDGVYGLRRAFLQAGARSLVMSLWSVPDKETKELMERFYKNLTSGGMNRAQALRHAALDQLAATRDKHGHANPLFWGGFVFLGEP